MGAAETQGSLCPQIPVEVCAFPRRDTVVLSYMVKPNPGQQLGAPMFCPAHTESPPQAGQAQSAGSTLSLTQCVCKAEAALWERLAEKTKGDNTEPCV